MRTLLVVTTDHELTASLSARLRHDEVSVLTAETTAAGLAVLARQAVEAVLLEPTGPGLDALATFQEQDALIPVLVLTRCPSAEDAAAAAGRGAFAYLPSPCSEEKLLGLLREALDWGERRRRSAAAQPESALDDPPESVGSSAAILEAYQLIGQVARSDVAVLVRGETGTGKELAALAIHQGSHRQQGPFVPVNCAAIPEGLLESEVFGHERGAFTGADRQRKGHFESAAGGTLFLNEVGDMPLSMQVKLLRVLQDRRFARVGGSAQIKSDVRVVAATHRDLEALLAEGRFREDLYRRLDGVTVRLPPLRQRLADLPLLVDQLLHRCNRELGKVVRRIEPAVWALFERHNWPGNVRELESVLRHGVLLARTDLLTVACLPEHLRAAATSFVETPLPDLTALTARLYRAGEDNISQAVQVAAERAALVEVLRLAGGNQSEAAKRLGVGRNTLWRKMRDLGLCSDRAS
jgi:two-component system nitrogen regulation response regulator GlnG